MVGKCPLEYLAALRPFVVWVCDVRERDIVPAIEGFSTMTVSDRVETLPLAGRRDSGAADGFRVAAARAW